MLKTKSLFTKRVLPLAISYLLLIVLAIVLDYVLHLINQVWIGRYLGIVGTILIIVSFTYSARKRNLIRSGSPKFLLRLHESLTWMGAMMILIHSGIHFYAVLPWLAAVSMMIVVASGHAGKFLLKKAREDLRLKKNELVEQGLSDEELEKTLFWDSLTVNIMNQWRLIHIPFVMVFITLAVLHILSIFFFWNWK